MILEGEKLTPEAIARSDVLYCTRLQKERFEDLGEYERLRGGLIVDNATLKHAKSQMVVMHPLPRNQEVGEEVDFDQRAAYFRQLNHYVPLVFGVHSILTTALDEARVIRSNGLACLSACSVDDGMERLGYLGGCLLGVVFDTAEANLI